MAIEDRRGTCRVCNGPAYRVPNQMPDTPDKWVHLNVATVLDNPHEVDPIPNQEEPNP